MFRAALRHLVGLKGTSYKNLLRPELEPFCPQLARTGIVLDRKWGNLLKIDFAKRVVMGYHGFKMMSRAELFILCVQSAFSRARAHVLASHRVGPVHATHTCWMMGAPYSSPGTVVARCLGTRTPSAGRRCTRGSNGRWHRCSR